MILSIILPAYNVEQYISNSLDSILRQEISEHEYEIIIVNDGSTDKTLDIINQYKNEHHNISVISTPNQGQSHARNIGFEHAAGDYIFFMDSDDYLTNGAFQQILKALPDSSEIIAFSWKKTDIIDEYDAVKKESSVTQMSNEEFMKSPAFNITGAWIYWYKKEFIDRHHLRFIDGRYFEDAIYSCVALSKAETVTYVDYDVYRYYQRPNSTVSSKTYDHVKKLWEDAVFAGKYLDELYHDCLTNQNKNYISIGHISNWYFVAAQIKMLKIGNFREAKKELDSLQKQGFYPYRLYNKPKELKYKLMHLLFSHKIIFCFVCGLANILRKTVKRTSIHILFFG